MIQVKLPETIVIELKTVAKVFMSMCLRTNDPVALHRINKTNWTVEVMIPSITEFAFLLCHAFLFNSTFPDDQGIGMLNENSFTDPKMIELTEQCLPLIKEMLNEVFTELQNGQPT